MNRLLLIFTFSIASTFSHAQDWSEPSMGSPVGSNRLWGISLSSGSVDDFGAGIFIDMLSEKETGSFLGTLWGAEYLRSNDENFVRLGGVVLTKAYSLGFYGGAGVRLGDNGIEAADIEIAMGYGILFFYARPILPYEKKVDEDVDFGLRATIPFGGI